MFAYDKRKFPAGDSRKKEIFTETFEKFSQKDFKKNLLSTTNSSICSFL
ncbi:MAG: hypothetical protein MRERC_1c130 [Mycoplasmataceae bacterium RC_NB112A]|nr:MAG: hypothetical protein MRERC_1c130 [Mycoplasmataceae bacterium RC_NB112A]